MWMKRSLQAVVLAVGLVCVRASAGGPQLPATAIGEDTFVVIAINPAKLDAPSLDASVKAILGDNAAVAKDSMDKAKAEFTEMTQAGAEQVTIVMSGKDTVTPPQPIVYVKMKPGSDHAAAEKMIRAREAQEKTEASEISNEGDFLITRKKGTVLPTEGSAARKQAFADAFGDADKAVSLIFIPTPPIRDQLKQQAAAPGTNPMIAAALPLLADSQWISVEATLGDAPAIALTVQAADDTGAKGLNDVVKQAAAQMQAMALMMQRQGAQGAAISQAISAVATALQPTQAGSKVSLSIDGKSVGPAIMNFLPAVLGAQGGGAGGPSGPGGGPGGPVRGGPPTRGP